MTLVKKHFGVDLIDIAIQVFVTGLAMGFVDQTASGSAADGLMFAIPAASALVLAWRRSRGLKHAALAPPGLTTGQMAAARIEELEQRVAELESTSFRMTELEERLDFAERLLAQGTGERALPQPERRGRHG